MTSLIDKIVLRGHQMKTVLGVALMLGATLGFVLALPATTMDGHNRRVGLDSHRDDTFVVQKDIDHRLVLSLSALAVLGSLVLFTRRNS